MLASEKGAQMNEWQYTNQFFEEGRIHFSQGGSVNDCPYDYLDVDQDNEKLIQSELYRQMEWLAGFQFQFKESLVESKIA